MNANDLQIFKVTYQSASFSQAADHLYMSPQGLTKAITRLERELDIPLFERSKKGIVPTPYGDALYKRAGDLDAILNEIASMKSAPESKKTVNLYSTYGVLDRLGYAFFEEFQDENKNIILNLIEYPDSALHHNFKMSRANLGFVTNPVDFGNYKSTYAFSQRVSAVLSAKNPLGTKSSLSLQEIAGYPLAIRGREYNIFEKNASYFLRRDLQIDIRLETSQDSFIIDFARKNRGIGIMQDCVLRRPQYRALLEEKELVQIPIDGPDFSTDVFLIENTASRLPDEDCLLRDYLHRKLQANTTAFL